MLKKTTLLLLAILLLFSCDGRRREGGMGSELCARDGGGEESPGVAPPEKDFSMKGIWLSQFDLEPIYKKGDSQRPREDFIRRMEEILDRIQSMGFDTVVVQVHPYGDSFYESALFPWSPFVTGSFGKKADYDPFRLIGELCRERGLKLHAWINPLRLMKENEILLLEKDHWMRRWYESGEGQITLWEGRCYFDPSFPEVREKIAQAARELCEGYPVDGVHIDDYFYPTQEEMFDAKGYAAYRKAGGSLNREDFRRESVSALVKLLYDTVKQKSAGLLFGVSPAGNMDNDYECLYADVFRWCGEKGYLDYVCPQLYFGFEHEKLPFDGICDRWRQLCQSGGTALVIGVSFHKAGIADDLYAGKGRGEWALHDDILKRSVLWVKEAGGAAGICVFSYSYLFDPVSGETPTQSAGEVKNFLSVFPDLTF